jgi:hypothetical protein
MDNKTNDKGPSGTEGEQVNPIRVGDIVWVKFGVIDIAGENVRLMGNSGSLVGVHYSECRHENDMLDGTEVITNYKRGVEVQDE